MYEFKRRTFELFNAWTTGEVASVADVIAPHFQEIDRPQALAQGLDGLRAKIALFHQAHARVTLKVHRQIVQGEQVCTRWTLAADRRTADDPEIQTSQKVCVRGVSWTQFANGKIVRNIVHRDILSELMQRGFQWAPGTSPGMTYSKGRASAAASHETASARDLLQQMLRASQSRDRFRDFLGARLASDVRGSVAPHQGLAKANLAHHLTDVFALSSGGQVSMLAMVGEGYCACASVLLTSKKHDLQYTQWLDPQAEVLVEASIWLDINDTGQIVELHFVGDMLTPGLARGLKMVRVPEPTTFSNSVSTAA